MTQSPKRRYYCPYCSRPFPVASSFDNHLIRIHKISKYEERIDILIHQGYNSKRTKPMQSTYRATGRCRKAYWLSSRTLNMIDQIHLVCDLNKSDIITESVHVYFYLRAVNPNILSEIKKDLDRKGVEM